MGCNDGGPVWASSDQPLASRPFILWPVSHGANSAHIRVIALCAQIVTRPEQI